MGEPQPRDPGDAAVFQDLARQGLAWRQNAAPAAPVWDLPRLSGRYVELACRGPAARLTCAAQLVLEAQLAREPAAWVTTTASSFYPPDLADNGVDLSALVVVRVATALALLRAAETLLRAGAFGLVVVDLESARDTPRDGVALATQTRLLGLAQHHGTLLLCLTRSDDAAPHALSSLRAEASLAALGGGRFASRVQAVKDKRASPGWQHEQVCRGAMGL